MSKKPKTLTAHADVSGPCPFCHRTGGTITVDFHTPQPDGGTGLVLHSLPTCETYDRLSADDFVRAVIDKKHLD
jgi:hypothetical protein